jgi:hypothetical protein
MRGPLQGRLKHRRQTDVTACERAAAAAAVCALPSASRIYMQYMSNDTAELSALWCLPRRERNDDDDDGARACATGAVHTSCSSTHACACKVLCSDVTGNMYCVRAACVARARTCLPQRWPRPSYKAAARHARGWRCIAVAAAEPVGALLVTAAGCGSVTCHGGCSSW